MKCRIGPLLNLIVLLHKKKFDVLTFSQAQTSFFHLLLLQPDFLKEISLYTSRPLYGSH